MRGPRTDWTRTGHVRDRREPGLKRTPPTGEQPAWPRKAVRNSSPATGAPRVQIEYDVEALRRREEGAAALRDGRGGRSVRASPPSRCAPVADRKFLEFDVDNFDDAPARR